MSTFRFHPNASKDLAVNWSKAQVFFFVMTSRSNDAMVYEIHIGAEVAKRHARMMGTCTRVGRIDKTGEHPIAVTM